MLHRREVPALLRAPVVHDIARRVGKKPAQVRGACLIRLFAFPVTQPIWQTDGSCAISPPNTRFS
jgi:hypothetical protein